MKDVVFHLVQSNTMLTTPNKNVKNVTLLVLLVKIQESMVVELVSMDTTSITDTVEKSVHMECSKTPQLEIVIIVLTHVVTVLVPPPHVLIVVKVLTYSL
jgi:hypothetical protein